MRRKHVRDYVADETVQGGYRYVGEYYIDKNEPELRKKISFINILIGVLELIVAFIALSLNCIGNRTIYVVIPLEIMMICAFMYIMGAYAYQKTNERMEKRHYEDSVQRMVHMSMIAFFMNLCSIIGQFYIVFKGYYFSEKYLEYVLLVILILLGVVNFVIWNGKRKIINCIIKE
jgi:hypothetical protein